VYASRAERRTTRGIGERKKEVREATTALVVKRQREDSTGGRENTSRERDGEGGRRGEA